MTAVFYLSLFALGLSAGSFVNVLTLRYRPERSFFSRNSFGGRSRCPSCESTLRWYELIPLLSFVVQGGKCRSCGARLARQYPLVELAAAAFAVALPLVLSSWHGIRGVTSLEAPLWYYGYLFIWYLVVLVWLSIVVVDLKHYLIPDELNLTLAVLGGGLITLAAMYGSELAPFHSSFLGHYALLFSPASFEGTLLPHLAGALVGGLFFAILALVARGAAMGFGDVKLAAVSGLILGWPDVAFAAAAAFVVGGAWGGFLMALRKKRLGDKLPFAPFLVLGFLVTMVFGFRLLSAYFTLFNF